MARLGCDFVYETLEPIGDACLESYVSRSHETGIPPSYGASILHSDSSAVTHPMNSGENQADVMVGSVSNGDGVFLGNEDFGAGSIVFRRIVDDLDDVEDFVSLDDERDGDEEIDYLPLNLEEVEEDVGTRQRNDDESSIPAITSSVPLSVDTPPWARTRGDEGIWVHSPLLQLHQEIVDFCDFVSPTHDEQLERTAAVERVTDVVQSIWPQAKVRVFGSFATGLYLPTSDIDVVILESGCEDTQSGLKALGKAVIKQCIGKNVQVISHARVPIVKFVEKESDISFDISFDVENGPQAAEFIKDAIAALPPLKPLCLVLKIFLQQRELNEVYTGGLGSYMLLVMLLTHLQVHPSRRSSSVEPSILESNLGILLVDFLDLYGHSLNVRNVGISCRHGGEFFKKRSRGFLYTKRPQLLAVEDPQRPDNDIGKNSFNIQKVRTAFVAACRLLTTTDDEKIPLRIGLLGRIVRVDEKLAGRKMTFVALMHERKFVPLLPLTYSENDGKTYLQGDGQRCQMSEDDFPREVVERHISKRGIKRKRARNGPNERRDCGVLPSKTSKHSKQLKRSQVHTKEKNKRHDRRYFAQLKSAGLDFNQDRRETRKAWKIANGALRNDFVLNINAFPSNSKKENHHFQTKQKWIDQSSSHSSWTGQTSKRAKIGKTQANRGSAGFVEHREWPLRSFTTTFTTSASRKINYH